MSIASTTVDLARDVASGLPAAHLIGGRWTDPVDGGHAWSVSPADEERLARIADGTAADVEAAVDAATWAAPGWRRTPWTRRASILRDLAAALAAHRDEFAALDVVDAGLPLEGAGFDVDGTVEDLLYFAGLAGEIKGTTLPRAASGWVSTYRSPYGVVGRIIPFNHPFRFAASKIAAPLIAGNSVVLKPSEHTPLSALRFGQIASEILPPGVLNIVIGDGGNVGAPLVGHPGVPRIALTGSVAAGRAVLRAAAEHIKHVTLELGGKNPFVLLPGADVEAAATAAVRGMNLWRTAGQSCQSTSVVHVHQDLHDDFVDQVEVAFEALRVGPPEDPDSDVGPLAFGAHYERVLGHIDRARQQGARLRAGGGRPEGIERGYYVTPTLFDEVSTDMSIANDEVFGPVLAVTRWQDQDRLLASLNRMPLGLTANVWGPQEVAEVFAEELEAGLVWINGRGGKPPATPFGGFKLSGIGKEGSLEEVLSYTQEKAIVRP